MSITLLELAASFVVSYVANLVPIPFKPTLKRRITVCYNKARRKWKCPAVRERYEGKEFKYLDELKQYVTGKNGEIDEELNKLLSRWAFEMQSDPICADYLLSLKADELLSITRTFPQLFDRVLDEIQILSGSLTRIEGSLEKQDEKLDEIKDLGEQTKASIDLMNNRSEEYILEPFLCKNVFRYNPKYDSTIYQGSNLTVSDLFITPVYSLSRFSDQGEEVLPVSDSVIADCKSAVNDNGILLIKGPYGSGKTILTKALIGKFRKEGLFIVCFQANRLNNRFFSELRVSIEKCISLHPKLYIFIDSCEVLLSDADFVYDVSTLLWDFGGKVHFIINYRSIQNNESDKILKDSRGFLSPAVLSLEYFNSTSIQRWLDRYNSTRIGLKTSVITYDDIQNTNKNLRTTCENPLILYMVSSSDDARLHLLKKNWYAIFDEFIKKTIMGKFAFEKECNPVFLKYHLSQDEYYRFLANVAGLINRDSVSKHLLSQASEDDFYLDSNEELYSIVAEKIKRYVPRKIANDFLSDDDTRIIPESIVQLLNCYFFEVSDSSCRFKDNNVLFFFKAYNYSNAIKDAINIYNNDIGNLKKCLDRLSSATSGMIIHPIEIEFILNFIENSNLTEKVREMIYSMISYGVILNIEEEGRCKVDYKLIKVETLLCIIYMKFLRNDYSDEKMRFFFKRLSQYHSFAKLVDNDLSSIIQRYFSGITISQAEFRRINLKNYNFNGSILNNTKFIQCKLESPSIKNLSCKNTTFDMCLISNIKDSNASVSGTITFKGCKLKDVTINVNKTVPGTMLRFEECVIDQMNIFTNSEQSGVRILTSFNDCIIRQCRIKADILFLSIQRVLFDRRIQVDCDFCKYYLGQADVKLTTMVKANYKKLSIQDDEIKSFD